MTNAVNSSDYTQKEIARNQINRQIEEFLNKGGSIDVLQGAGVYTKNCDRSVSCHGRDDLYQMID